MVRLVIGKALSENCAPLALVFIAALKVKTTAVLVGTLVLRLAGETDTSVGGVAAVPPVTKPPLNVPLSWVPDASFPFTDQMTGDFAGKIGLGVLVSLV